MKELSFLTEMTLKFVVVVQHSTCAGHCQLCDGLARLHALRLVGLSLHDREELLL